MASFAVTLSSGPSWLYVQHWTRPLAPAVAPPLRGCHLAECLTWRSLMLTHHLSSSLFEMISPYGTWHPFHRPCQLVAATPLALCPSWHTRRQTVERADQTEQVQRALSSLPHSSALPDLSRFAHWPIDSSSWLQTVKDTQKSFRPASAPRMIAPCAAHHRLEEGGGLVSGGTSGSWRTGEPWQLPTPKHAPVGWPACQLAPSSSWRRARSPVLFFRTRKSTRRDCARRASP
mmetsp:Transcript_15102/g.18219  ORF Transcript_15102/g.18219 Transcript_15102/m.18219 type:complete len:232 (+) Transcript_15102:884-1579(+)